MTDLSTKKKLCRLAVSLETDKWDDSFTICVQVSYVRICAIFDWVILEIYTGWAKLGILELQLILFLFDYRINLKFCWFSYQSKSLFFFVLRCHHLSGINFWWLVENYDFFQKVLLLSKKLKLCFPCENNNLKWLT